MSDISSPKKSSQPNAILANCACFGAMAMWAVGFPAAEILLQSWGALSLNALRQLLAVGCLLIFWLAADGWMSIYNARWLKGTLVGGIGFGIGSMLLLVGQKLSDPVTPAIAAAMMPIAGAALEVIFDGRQLKLKLIIGIVLALTGGYLATGINLENSSFGFGALICLTAVILFAWGTRATTQQFKDMSPIGQTTLTLSGAVVVTLVVYLVALGLGFQETKIGKVDSNSVSLILVFSLVSLAVAQLLWIKAAGSLGILLASFHMNAVPFYVMVVLVIMFNHSWDWIQAIGAAIVACGVTIVQWPGSKSR
jgi:drug/metabolite transporter (DMT)-like permease